MDQTLGKPGSYLAGVDKAGNVKPMTIGARLYRVEQQVFIFTFRFLIYTRLIIRLKQILLMDKKLDQVLYVCNSMTSSSNYGDARSHGHIA